MEKYSSNDDYLDAKTGVMKNKLGFDNQADLEAFEGGLVAVRTSQLAEIPLENRDKTFDLPHMQRIHKHLFGDIYEWAGDLRTIDISKGTTRFANWTFIEREAEKLSIQLASENFLQGLDRKEFAERAGYYLGEWNVLHPFREGNGRTLREFIGQLAYQAGYFINWTKTNQEQMIRASIEAYHGQSELMGLIILDNLQNSLSEIP
ncbi:Fic/DOC family protein [Thalassospira alkalitolerans]|uniref:Fic/DOC family protein n=1 Tax=Thalassospira alkalitolerans TaxID=1293890 RepID=UPI003AA85A6C